MKRKVLLIAFLMTFTAIIPAYASSTGPLGPVVVSPVGPAGETQPDQTEADQAALEAQKKAEEEARAQAEAQALAQAKADHDVKVAALTEQFKNDKISYMSPAQIKTIKSASIILHSYTVAEDGTQTAVDSEYKLTDADLQRLRATLETLEMHTIDSYLDRKLPLVDLMMTDIRGQRYHILSSGNFDVMSNASKLMTSKELQIELQGLVANLYKNTGAVGPYTKSFYFDDLHYGNENEAVATCNVTDVNDPLYQAATDYANFINGKDPQFAVADELYNTQLSSRFTGNGYWIEKYYCGTIGYMTHFFFETQELKDAVCGKLADGRDIVQVDYIPLMLEEEEAKALVKVE